MSRWNVVAETFVELADTISDDFDVLDFLHNLVVRTVEITGAAAAGLILADQRGRLRLVASTDHATQVLELFALATEAGPCIDSFRTGQPVINVASDEAAERWPMFMAAAEACGFGSAHVVPMRIRSEVLGALSIFDAPHHRLQEDDQAILQALASVATIGLLQERTPRQREILAEQMQAALNEQIAVEQVKGVVAEQLDIEIAEAFALLRAHAQRTRLGLGRVASLVLAGEIRPHQLQA
jgi:transcriptional regulator with GAF, ATPase, and Fis domain